MALEQLSQWESILLDGLPEDPKLLSKHLRPDEAAGEEGIGAASKALESAGYVEDAESSPEVIAAYGELTRVMHELAVAVEPLSVLDDLDTAGAGRLPAVLPKHRAANVERLEEAEAPLVKIIALVEGGASISLEHRIRVANMIARLESMRFRLEEPYMHKNPAWYTEKVLEVSLNLTRDGFAESSEHLVGYMETHCHEIADFLPEAEQVLKDFISEGGKIPKLFVMIAKGSVEAMLAMVNETYAEAMGEVGAEARQEAVAAIEAYSKFLDETMHDGAACITETGSNGMGEEKLAKVYRYDRGLGDLPPRDVVAMGEKLVQQHKAELDELKGTLSERYGIDKALSVDAFFTALEPHMQCSENGDLILEKTRRAFDFAERFFQEHAGIVPVESAPIEVDRAPAFLDAYGFMVFFPNMQKGKEKPTGQYLIGIGGLNFNSKEASFPHLIQVATHEGTPGHLNQGHHVKEAGDPNLFRGGMGNVGMVEGWALLSEQIAADNGFFEAAADEFGVDADLVKLFYIQGKLLRAARMVVDPKMQMNEMSPDEAKQYLVNEVACDEKYAGNQLAVYMSQPGYFSTYYPGAIILKALREMATEELTSGELEMPMTQQEAQYWFHERYLKECGLMPANLISRYILAKVAAEKKSRMLNVASV